MLDGWFFPKSFPVCEKPEARRCAEVGKRIWEVERGRKKKKRGKSGSSST
jgi:hypothetical protein